MRLFFYQPLLLLPSQASAELLYGGYGPDPTNFLIFLAIIFAGYLGSKLLSVLQPNLSYSGISKSLVGVIGGFTGMYLVVWFFDAIGTRPDRTFGVGVVLIFAVICGYLFAAIWGLKKRSQKSDKH